MYAVFRSGGKQYRATAGERLKLEKLDAEEGSNVSFDEVLLVGEGSNIKVGSPLLAGSSVSAKVLKQGKSKKVSVIKFKRRQNYLRQQKLLLPRDSQMILAFQPAIHRQELYRCQQTLLFHLDYSVLLQDFSSHNKEYLVQE